jgi:outer membrane protein OmpA-like peptidoglycan-associated protein
MNGLSKLILPCLGALLVVGCGTQLEQAQGLTPKGSAFDKSLYQGYLDLSASEFGEGDYGDSDVFAQRAMRAGTGQGVQPEEIDHRALPADKLGELSTARGRLTAALASPAAADKPAEAAKAQVMFDCWMQEQEENFQPDHIAACRSGYIDAIAKLEEVPAKTVAEAVSEPAPLPGPYVVLFDFNKAELTPEAKAVLAEVVRNAGAAKASRIISSGYADRAGASAYNEELAKRRVDAVVSYLQDSGIEKSKLVAASYGESQLPVRTADGQPERQNRRVQIEFAR